MLCVESYIGDPETRQGVKIEDQFMIDDDHVERLSNYSFDPRLAIGLAFWTGTSS